MQQIITTTTDQDTQSDAHYGYENCRTSMERVLQKLAESLNKTSGYENCFFLLGKGDSISTEDSFTKGIEPNLE